MHRILIGVAVAVVVLAVGAIVTVAWLRPSDTKTTQPVAVAPAETTEVETEPVRRTRPAARPAAAPAESDEEPPAIGDAPPPDDMNPAAAGGENMDEKIKAILDTLTEDEQRALMRAMAGRMMRDRMEQRRYDLPSDRRLRVLERGRNEAIRLSDVQRDQLNALKENLKPKIDAAMSDIWQKQEQLRQQGMQLMSEGKRDEARTLFEQMNELRQQGEQAMAPIDEEYKVALSGILTPEQQEAVNSAETSDDGGRRRDFGGPPGGNFGGRRGGNAAGGGG
ncbi:MAG: Spy/CpxP family protein refolding chaperone [Planctomycetes bacterium]|nr:Spy/CpxP family protein refolding chaperone [Planctomycetota bacterium]